MGIGCHKISLIGEEKDVTSKNFFRLPSTELRQDVLLLQNGKVLKIRTQGWEVDGNGAANNNTGSSGL